MQPRPPTPGSERAKASRHLAAPAAGVPSKHAQARVVLEIRARLAAQAGVPLRSFPIPPWLDFRIRSECYAIMSDGTGRKAIRYLLQLPARQRMLVLREVNRVGGTDSVAGRRIVQCAWTTWRLSKRVRGGRGQRWGGGQVVDGYARAVWCLLCVNADGSQPSLSTLWGTHTGSRHVPGPMNRLAHAGVWTRVQPPADVAQYVGPSGWAVGQMWYGRKNCGRKPLSEAEEAESAAGFSALLAALDPG